MITNSKQHKKLIANIDIIMRFERWRNKKRKEESMKGEGGAQQRILRASFS
jgi:hypothetical protein